MSRLTTLLANDEEDMCSSLGSDYVPKKEGTFTAVASAFPCGHPCSACVLSTPYPEIQEVLDEQIKHLTEIYKELLHK